MSPVRTIIDVIVIANHNDGTWFALPALLNRQNDAGCMFYHPFSMLYAHNTRSQTKLHNKRHPSHCLNRVQFRYISRGAAVPPSRGHP